MKFLVTILLICASLAVEVTANPRNATTHKPKTANNSSELANIGLESDEQTSSFETSDEKKPANSTVAAGNKTEGGRDKIIVFDEPSVIPGSYEELEDFAGRGPPRVEDAPKIEETNQSVWQKISNWFSELFE